MTNKYRLYFRNANILLSGNSPNNPQANRQFYIKLCIYAVIRARRNLPTNQTEFYSRSLRNKQLVG